MKNILMNVEMTKAILDGRKVQTRRVLKDSRIEDIYINENGKKVVLIWGSENYLSKYIEVNSKYQVGETIWVREPARVVEHHSKHDTMEVEYLSDKKREVISIPEKYIGYLETSFGTLSVYTKWIQLQQGIPNGCIKEMARIFLKITNVRVERLHDISDDDCISEGLQYHENGGDYYYVSIGQPDWVNFTNIFGDHLENKESLSLEKLAFKNLWNSTAPKGYKWEDNPYVFVYEFEKVEG